MGTSTGKTDEPSVKAFKHIFRGARVDWRMAGRVQRRNGVVVVVDIDHAWVQFPEMDEPCKYPTSDLGPAELPPFREFVANRPDSYGHWQARSGEPMSAYMTRIADALADYADEIRRRAS